MRLFLPSLFMWLYVTFSLIRPLPLQLPLKITASLLLLVAGLKYLLYEQLGASFFAPELPRTVLLIMEAFYLALVVLFFLVLTRDLLQLLFWILRKIHLVQCQLPLSGTLLAGSLLAVSLGLGAWGTWQSVRVPAVHTVEIKVPDLPTALDGFSIVQLTDLHIRTLLDKNWLQAVTDRTNALHPDLIALTGDYNDGRVQELAPSMQPLAELRAKYGVYGVTGNHEYYFHAEEWTELLRSLGVRMLDNEHQVIHAHGAELVIAGVPDFSEPRFGGHGPDLQKTLQHAPDVVRILLAHQPSDAENILQTAAGKAATTIQLSGHTHGGLLFFLKPLLARFNDGFVDGLYDRGKLQLYVSPGTGIWGGFSCRLGVPSEITHIILRAGGQNNLS